MVRGRSLVRMYRIIGFWVAAPLAMLALCGLLVGSLAIYYGDGNAFLYFTGAGLASAVAFTALTVGYMLREVRA